MSQFLDVQQLKLVFSFFTCIYHWIRGIIYPNNNNNNMVAVLLASAFSTRESKKPKQSSWCCRLVKIYKSICWNLLLYCIAFAAPINGRRFSQVRWLRCSAENRRRSARARWTHLPLQLLRIHRTGSQPHLHRLLQTLPIQNRQFHTLRSTIPDSHFRVQFLFLFDYY